MQEELKEKVGKLTFVAKTAGLHLDNNSEWINPASEVKDELIAQIEWMKGNLGYDVKLKLNDKGYYTKMDVVGKTVKKAQGKEKKPVPVVDHNPNAQVNRIELPVKPKEAKKAPESMIVKTEETKPKEEETVQKATKTPATRMSHPGMLQEEDKGYFNKLQKIAGEVVKKGHLTYISWAEAWALLKKEHPDAVYHVYENGDGLPYFADHTGGMVKVGVAVNNIEHVVWLPVMDNTKQHQAIEWLKITTFDINKAIQRAMTKAIAMHGLGLYVYRGEDIPGAENQSTDEDPGSGYE